MVKFEDLIKVGLHFGHQRLRWSPKMKPYIWGHRNGVHLIDVSKIAYNLEKAAEFLRKTSAEGKTIFWVGTKKSAANLIKEIGTQLSMPFVNHRWIGGTLTNFFQVKKAVAKYLNLKELVDKSKDIEQNIYTKKEISLFNKNAAKLERIVGGLKDLKLEIGAIVIIDAKKEFTALSEANKAGIPVVSLVDTNIDPTGIDYVIPGNDDSLKGVKFILDYLKAAVEKGVLERALLDESEVSDETVTLVKKESSRFAFKAKPRQKVAAKQEASEVVNSEMPVVENILSIDEADDLVKVEENNKDEKNASSKQSEKNTFVKKEGEKRVFKKTLPFKKNTSNFERKPSPVSKNKKTDK